MKINEQDGRILNEDFFFRENKKKGEVFPFINKKLRPLFIKVNEISCEIQENLLIFISSPTRDLFSCYQLK